MVSAFEHRLGRWSLAVSLAVIAVLKIVSTAKTESFLIPWLWFATTVEAAAAILLVTKLWRAGSWITAAFACVALAVMGLFCILGIDMSKCGCFGAFKVSDGLHVVIAVAYFLLAASLLVSDIASDVPNNSFKSADFAQACKDPGP